MQLAIFALFVSDVNVSAMGNSNSIFEFEYVCKQLLKPPLRETELWM